MAHAQSPFRRRWTLTAWSCLGAIGVTTLLFVTIFQAHGSRHGAGAPHKATAVTAMDRPAFDRDRTTAPQN